MEDEARTYFRKWGNEGTADLLADMNKLTILTASRCLLGNIPLTFILFYIDRKRHQR
jgi:hypothetical protein